MFGINKELLKLEIDGNQKTLSEWFWVINDVMVW
jgi:hypothetical protein